MRLYANLDLDIDTQFVASTSTRVVFPGSSRAVRGEVNIDSVGGGAMIQGSPADLCRLAAALAEAAEKAKAANARVAAVTDADGAA